MLYWKERNPHNPSVSLISYIAAFRFGLLTHCCCTSPHLWQHSLAYYHETVLQHPYFHAWATMNWGPLSPHIEDYCTWRTQGYSILFIQYFWGLISVKVRVVTFCPGIFPLNLCRVLLVLFLFTSWSCCLSFANIILDVQALFQPSALGSIHMVCSHISLSL